MSLTDFQGKKFSSENTIFILLIPAKCYADNFIQSTSDILQNILKGNHRLVLSDLPIKTRLTIDANSPEELMCVHNEPVRWIPKVKLNQLNSELKFNCNHRG